MAVLLFRSGGRRRGRLMEKREDGECEEVRGIGGMHSTQSRMSMMYGESKGIIVLQRYVLRVNTLRVNTLCVVYSEHSLQVFSHLSVHPLFWLHLLSFPNGH